MENLEPIIQDGNDENNKTGEPEYAPVVDVTEFPGYSTYEEKKCCCCKLIYFPDLKTYFIGHYEVDPSFPIFVSLLAVSAFVVMCVLGPGVFNIVELVIIEIILFIFLFMFLLNFFLVIVEGPGYYPFSLSHDNGEPPSQWAGIQTTFEQQSWVQLQGRPPRSTFFKTAHRYVIRPDHFCGWTSSWIGKRNFKFFILFNFYGMIYLTLFSIYMIRTFIHHCFPLNVSASFILSVMYAVLGGFFAFMTGNFFFDGMIHAFNNETSWENWNKIDNSKFRKSNWKENLQDVFGDENMFLWFCPTCPWRKYSNAEISAGYVTYDES